MNRNMSFTLVEVLIGHEAVTFHNEGTIVVMIFCFYGMNSDILK